MHGIQCPSGLQKGWQRIHISQELGPYTYIQLPFSEGTAEISFVYVSAHFNARHLLAYFYIN